MTIPAAQPRVDGRTARAVRTRAAIVDALLALLQDGELRPTGERIADRAGVSLRALWTNFKDMESVYAAAGSRLIERQLAAYRRIEPDRPLAERVDAFCAQRAVMLEIIAPAARASVLREPFSPQLRCNRAVEIARVRDEIGTVFAAELAAAGPGRDELHDALVATGTYATWSVLRDHLRLDVPTATRVLRRTVAALLSTGTGA